MFVIRRTDWSVAVTEAGGVSPDCISHVATLSEVSKLSAREHNAMDARLRHRVTMTLPLRYHALKYRISILGGWLVAGGPGAGPGSRSPC